MKSILKIIVSILVFAVLFVVVITGIFLAVFDANEYKQEVSDLVREQTGRELQFYGDVSLTIYPVLGMELGGMSFSNAPGFGAADMIKVNKASISVDVGSLIAFNPQVNQLILDDLEINLQKNAAGVTNWDDLLVAADSAATQSQDPAASSAPTSGSSPTEIKGSFGGLVMNNARLLWQDAQTGVEYRIDDLDITTGPVSADKPFALQIHMALQSKNEMDAIVDLGGEIQYLVKTSQVKISDLKLQVVAQGSALPLSEIEAGIASQSLLLDLQRNRLKLEGMELNLDDNLLTGMLEVTDFARPALNFKLASHRLDVDALLGTPSVAQKAQMALPANGSTTSGSAAAKDVQISLPMELLRSLQVEGQLSVKQIKIENLLLDDVELSIRANNGLLKLDPMKLNLYEGSYQGSVQIDARGKEPEYQVVETLEGVQIGQLLTDYMGEDRIVGEMAANASLTTEGEWLSALKKNSNGSMDIAFKDGALKGFNLRYSIDRVRAKMSNQPEPSKQPLQTDFSSLTMSGKIRNGIFSSNDLKLLAPLLRVGGEGIANINDNTIDYRVDVKLVGTVAGQEGGEADELSGLLIPVRIVGPFENPKIDVQLDEMLKAKAANLREQEKAKLKAEVEKQKAELQKQIDAEKARLEAAKQREKEKQRQVIEAEKKEAEQKLREKLKKLF
ncbi:MAG: AsmA family protein [Gammaproteobacteria bacterium]